MRPTVLMVLACCAWTPRAFAQSGPYVAASVGAAIFRADYNESGSSRYRPGDGEVLDFAIRAGVPVASVFGMEVEFSRSAKTDDTGAFFSPYEIAYLTGGVSWSSTGGTVPPGPPSVITTAPIRVMPSSRRQVSSLNALVTARRPVNGSIDLMFLGGVAFTRDVRDTSYSITPLLQTPGLLLGLPRVERSRYVDYQTQPLVGLEAHIALTSHARVTAGVRLQALSDGWLMRPGVGLDWAF